MKAFDITTAKHNYVVSVTIGFFIVELVLFTAGTSVISVLILCFVYYDQYI